MAAFTMKGSQLGPCAMPYLYGQNTRNINFCSRPSRQSNVVPSMAWSMDSGKRHRKLKKQGYEWLLSNGDYIYDGQPLQSHKDFLCSLSPVIHIDVLNRTRYPLLERIKLVATEQRKQRLKALQERASDFVDGLVEYICSEKENYKYVLIASKKNANMLIKEGFISSYARDEILNGLERIENDIEEGRFQWRNNKDLRTNIIEALIETVGGPAKRLDATISHYVQLLTVLQIWCHDSIDKVITQIKELQVELILLAIRNEGLVLPCKWRSANWILLGDVVLSQLEKLEKDVSRLVSCKNKMDSTLSTAFPSGRTDGSMDSLWKDGSHHIHNFALNFGNMIVGDISHSISNLKLELSSWMAFHLLTPNDKVTESVLLMHKHMLNLDDFTYIRSYSIYNTVEDSSKRFLAIYKKIPEILKAAREFAKNSSFNHEKVRNFLAPSGYFGASRLAEFHATKDLVAQNYQGGSAAEKRNFKIHSDDTKKKLHDWLLRLQSGQKN